MNNEYLTRHLITYLGNKRKLLPFIDSAVKEIKRELGVDQVSMFDGFSGSGCVSRLFKYHASHLYVNDLEKYSETGNRCYLANRSEVDWGQIVELIDWLNANKLRPGEAGFIEANYAPKDEKCIQPKERVFFTKQNARIIDTMRLLIRERVEQDHPELLPFVLAPLLVKTSIHNNTSGVFKGFHKKDGVGHFGGAGENALQRIMAEISLDYPIFCEVECPVTITRDDTNLAVSDMPEVDVAYYDPPYNQHPYGSNYFMLNIVNDYDDPEIQDGVSGIAKEWNRSAYNKRRHACDAMDALLGATKAKYILISYNNEGIIPIKDFRKVVEKHGVVSIQEQDYNTYRGSRNLKQRNIKVKEFLWMVKR